MKNIGVAVLLILYQIKLYSFQANPCYTGWVYKSSTGKCYKVISTKANYETASMFCNSNLTSLFSGMNGKVNLTIIQSITEAIVLSGILSELGNNEDQLMAGKWNEPLGKFTNPNGDVINVTGITKSSSNTNGNCLIFTYESIVVGSVFEKQYMFKSANCSQSFNFVCEHKTSACNENDVPGYDGATMFLDPPKSNVELPVVIKCREGYYRKQASPSGIGVLCKGESDGSNDPSKFTHSWSNFPFNGYIEQCIRVQCYPPFPDVWKYSVRVPPSEPIRTVYEFGYIEPLVCANGYVSFLNPTTVTSGIQCGQSSTNPALGEWKPVGKSPCAPIQCSKEQLLALIPMEGSLVKSTHRRTQEVLPLTNDNVEKVLSYDEIVSISCKAGQLWPDRKVVKRVICDVKNNSLVEGEWKGYNGDKVPFVKQCIGVTCLFEKVLVKSSSKIQKTFYFINKTGEAMAMQEHSGENYKLDAKLRFICDSGFKSATQHTEQNVTCGMNGEWEPQLTTCIGETEKIVTGTKKHFVPPPIEAKAAQEVGYVAIIILVVFLSFILLLDLTTFTRDIQLMRKNILYLKRRAKYKKQMAEASKEAK